MTVESALLSTFESECRAALGAQMGKLGMKARVLIRNISDVKRLIWTLLNADCVTFQNQLTDLRNFESIKDMTED